jgi:hypothetical protein
MSAFDVNGCQEEMKELELNPMHIEQLVNAVRECLKHSSKTSRTERLQ